MEVEDVHLLKRCLLKQLGSKRGPAYWAAFREYINGKVRAVVPPDPRCREPHGKKWQTIFCPQKVVWRIAADMQAGNFTTG